MRVVPGPRAEGLLLGTGRAAVTSTYQLGLQTAASPRPTDSGKQKLRGLGSASCSPGMPNEPRYCLSPGGSTARRWAPAQAFYPSPGSLVRPSWCEMGPRPRG